MFWPFPILFALFAVFLVTRALFWRRAGWHGGWGYGYAGCYGPPNATYGAGLTAEESLRQRLAAGEIDVDEFVRSRDALRK